MTKRFVRVDDDRYYPTLQANIYWIRKHYRSPPYFHLFKRRALERRR